jgi:hypothetical protein
MELWKLHLLASEYGQRPSGILGVQDQWAAYELDLACMTVARRAERAMADGKSVEEALGDSRKGDSRIAPTATAYADPRGLVTKRMRIPESGIW